MVSVTDEADQLMMMMISVRYLSSRSMLHTSRHYFSCLLHVLYVLCGCRMDVVTLALPSCCYNFMLML
jgi:hypothetical protein